MGIFGDADFSCLDENIGVNTADGSPGRAARPTPFDSRANVSINSLVIGACDANRGERGVMDREKLIDSIYEAALVPELWPRVLDGVALAGASSGATIFTLADQTGRWVSNDAVREAMTRFITEGWAARNERGRRTLEVAEPRFVADLDIFTPSEIEESPLYRDFLRPAGFGWGAGTIIRSMTDDLIAVTVERPHAHGPLSGNDVASLDDLRPHLARAALMASRLKLQKAQTAVEVLSGLRLPGAAVSATGRFVVTNPEFEDLAPDLIAEVATRLGFAASSGGGLRDGLAEDRRRASHGLSFPLKSADRRSVAIVHALPLVRDARDIFAAADWMVFLTGTNTGPGAAPGVLEGLFDLTPAEARVARALLAGGSVDEIARTIGITPGTVRGQLKVVFRKTGTRGQVDLVRLLGGIVGRV